MITEQTLPTLVHPSWVPTLAPLLPTLQALDSMVLADPNFLPPGPLVFRALQMPVDAVKVLIVGQDPYPTPGHAVGLSFAVNRDVRPLPRSLQNIYAELQTDLGLPPASHGDLSSWVDQGVMLLNRVLTVTPGQAGSHRNRGWELITEAVIATLAQRQPKIVAILWGAQARSLEPALHANGVPIITSAHPSPLSAHRGFFGSMPFSRANTLLQGQGTAPIDWTVR